MKNILKKLFCLSLLCFGVANVDAATLAISDDSTSAGAIEKSVSVELQDADLSEYTKVEFELSVSGTSYASIEFKPKTTSLSYSKEGNTYILEAKGPQTGATSLYATAIGEILYSTDKNLSSGFKIIPTNVKFYKSDGTVMQVGDSGIEIDDGEIKYEKPKSNDASLTSLTVSQGTLSPEFKSDTLEYEVTVPDTINIIKLTANAAEGATRTGTGNKTLVMGENQFDIVVTAEDGTTTKTYTIIINRGAVSEPSAYLKDLTINNIGCELSPEFDKKNNKYTVEVPAGFEELDIEYELEDENAKITIEGNENLTVGENLITIKIVASDESEEQTYEITANVLEEESTSEPIIVDDDEDKNKMSPWIIVGIVAGILVIAGGIALVLFKKKKNKKNKKDKTLKASEKSEQSINEEASVTDILRGELFDDEKTTTYEKDTFNEIMNESEDLEKTKEFNFKDFN